MALLKNIGLFLIVFLPVVALVSMTMEGVLGDRVAVPPEWTIGWDPVLWLIMTAPWLVPTVLVVPVLHFLGRGVRRRVSRGAARATVLVASPLLFSLAVLAMWGPGNFNLRFVLPVVVAGVVYGSVLRLPWYADRRG